MQREHELRTHGAEGRHWWYQGRRRVLERAIARLGLAKLQAAKDYAVGAIV